MKNNYEERKIDRYEKDEITIDTCAVTDSDEPYETGIKHPKYKDGEWVIVEMYNSKEEAETGHNKWVKIMTSDNLPEELVDVSTCTVVKLLKLLQENR